MNKCKKKIKKSQLIIRVQLQTTKYLVFSMVLKEKKVLHMNKDGGINMVVESSIKKIKYEKVNISNNNKNMHSVINTEEERGFLKYCHGGKLHGNIKIKMSVKWILYIFNELCDYLSQRKINK